MNCYIRLTKTDNVFTATVLGVPECSATAETREAALEQAKTALYELFLRDEIIEVEAPTRKEALARGIGIFADVDDATWAEYEAEITAYRAQVDASEQASMEAAEAV